MKEKKKNFKASVAVPNIIGGSVVPKWSGDIFT